MPGLMWQLGLLCHNARTIDFKSIFLEKVNVKQSAQVGNWNYYDWEKTHENTLVLKKTCNFPQMLDSIFFPILFHQLCEFLNSYFDVTFYLSLV